MIPLDSTELAQARDLLLKGDVVAIPTETVYGLAASIDSDTGLRKVFALKERPFFDPLIVHVSSIRQAHLVVSDWPPLADYLARTFWPGPLTLVLPKAETVSSLITSGLTTVAVRYPAHPVALELIRIVGSPLAAPSANKFGKTSPSSAQHVRDEFANSGLLVIDGGECAIGLESTVIALNKSNQNVGHIDEVQILRPGGVTEEMLQEALLKWWPAAHVTKATSAASPGSLEHHYMPRIPLIIVDALEDMTPSGVIWQQVRSQLDMDRAERPCELKLSEQPAEAARELYSEMRKLAESGADLLYVRALPERQGGLWTAIWDRLKRAATAQLSRNLTY